MGYNPGDVIEVVIDREGLSPGQGIGHLPDETMVVIVGAGARIGESVEATIIGFEQMRLGASVMANAKL